MRGEVRYRGRSDRRSSSGSGSEAAKTLAIFSGVAIGRFWVILADRV